MNREKPVFFDMDIDDREKNRQKELARKLRKTGWWQRKMSKGICYYCGNHFAPNMLTMDHIVPIARGGKSVKSNLVTACKECNNKKKYLLPIEWDEYLKRIAAREF